MSKTALEGLTLYQSKHKDKDEYKPLVDLAFKIVSRHSLTEDEVINIKDYYTFHKDVEDKECAYLLSAGAAGVSWSDSILNNLNNTSSEAVKDIQYPSMTDIDKATLILLSTN